MPNPNLNPTVSLRLGLGLSLSLRLRLSLRSSRSLQANIVLYSVTCILSYLIDSSDDQYILTS